MLRQEYTLSLLNAQRSLIIRAQISPITKNLGQQFISMECGYWVLCKNRYHGVGVWNTKNTLEKSMGFIGTVDAEQSHCYQHHFTTRTAIPLGRP